MKRLLLVSQHFPPDTAVGAVRPAKFAKYLPKYGWKPTVLTVDASYHAGLDPAAPSDDATGIPIHRTAFVRSPSHYYRALKRAVVGRRSVPSARSGSMNVTGTSAASAPASTLRDWINALLSFPDEHAGWVPFAFLKGRRIVGAKAIDCILTSGPPHSAHLIGAWLSAWHRRPWVADFRDPLFLETKSNRVAQRLDQRLEAYILERATRVVTTTDRFAEVLKARYPSHAEKVRTVSNGFDPDDFLAVPPMKADKFTISYVGSLYVGRDPEPILRAVATLIDHGVIPRDRIVLRFAGACEDAAGKPMRGLVASYGLQENVEVLGWLPKQGAFELMAQAHVVLLLAENQALMIPAKIYDYFAIGSDILALTQDGATADLLRETGDAAVHQPHDVVGIAKSIESFYGKYLRSSDETSGERSSADLSKYTREELTKSVARLLDEISSPAGSGRAPR